MHPTLRRIRGVLGTAVTWAVGWGTVGFLAGVPQWAVVGFTAGAGFAVALSLAERRSRAETLVLWRTALWGGVGAVIGGGVAVPWLWAMSSGALQLLPFLGVSALLGAGSATGTLLLVRRPGAQSRLVAPDGPREQLMPRAGRTAPSAPATADGDSSSDRDIISGPRLSFERLTREKTDDP